MSLRLAPLSLVAIFFSLLIGFSLVACQQSSEAKDSSQEKLNPQDSLIGSSEADCLNQECIQREKDEIFTLLAYSIVKADWQSKDVPRFERRGYNIGSVLVDPNGMPMYSELNCVTVAENATQHGEVRLMTKFLDSTEVFNLRDYTVYSSLEPCAMCGGMMVMTAVKRVVYGQHDVEFSGALERLAFDSHQHGGYKPYPRVVVSDPAPTPFCGRLDSAFQEFLATDEEKYLAKFLTSTEAEKIFEDATEAFLNYKVSYGENQPALEAARQLFETR